MSQGQVTITTASKGASPTVADSYAFPVVVGSGPHGRVGMGLSRTINLGNFESLRVECYVELPCDATESAVHSAIEACAVIAEQAVTARVGSPDEVRGETALAAKAPQQGKVPF